MDKLVKLLLGILLFGNLVWLRIPGEPVSYLTNKYVVYRVSALEKLGAALSLRKGVIYTTDLESSYRSLEVVCLRILVYKLVLIEEKEILILVLDSIRIQIIILSDSLKESVHHERVTVSDYLLGGYE